LGEIHVPTPRKAAAIVVLAAEGYPGTIRKGRVLEGLAEADALEGVRVLHAGTTRDDEGRLVSSGGRVVGVVGQGEDLPQAVSRAYAGVAAVRIEGAQWRTDIASRGLAALAK
jgi:phosphoribosylamine--glycine ligase